FFGLDGDPVMVAGALPAGSSTGEAGWTVGIGLPTAFPLEWLEGRGAADHPGASPTIPPRAAPGAGVCGPSTTPPATGTERVSFEVVPSRMMRPMSRNDVD